MLTELVSKLFHFGASQFHAVQEITSWNDLEPLRQTWKLMHGQTPNASFFQSWLWFESYWRHFGDAQQLRVLIAKESDGTPTGILPLTLRNEPHALGQIRRLGFPLENWGTGYGPLGPSPDETYAAGLQFIRNRLRDWDKIDLRWITSQGAQDVVSGFRRARMPFQQKLWSRTARIDLTRGWDEYWSSRTSKWRNNRRRADKALNRLGRIRFIHFRPSASHTDPRWDLYDMCEHVAAQSWQGASPSGNTLNHPHVRDFLREVHAAAVAAGCVYLSLLMIDDHPAAFTYNYLWNGMVHGLRMGYDLQFQPAGPGAVLLRETVRECFQRGDHTFDLGESESSFKRWWANQTVETYRFSHLSLANAFVNAVRWPR